MSYIGIPPQANFSSGLLDRFTSTTGTTVTLTHDIASENDIVVFVNFVKQDSTTYSVGGTGNKTLTLGGTLVSSDIVEVHYLNIVGQTNAPSSGSVTTATINDTAVTGAKLNTDVISSQTELATAPASTDELLISDAGVLKRVDVSLVGGDNTPYFQITLNAYQTISANTSTKVALDNARIDTASGFDATNDRWVVPSGQAGKYQISYQVFGDSGSGSELYILEAVVKINGTATLSSIHDFRNNNGRQASISNTAILDLAVSDYVELWGTVYDTSGSPQFGGGSSGGERYKSHLTGFKLIG